ncbi:MAG: tetratricopeptide repeat protein [Deltaproteobacteria bacterium]|nr:tetratricopeptide repeat protein [Deltaproteobacteria bacterium]
MAAKSPAKLKKEDQFISFWKRVYGFYDQHQKQFLAGLAGLVVAAAAVWGWIAFQNHLQAKAWDEYEAVLAEFSSKTGGQDQALKALSDIIDRHPGTKAGDQARLEMAALAAHEGDFELAVKYYLAFWDSLKPDDPLRPAVADALGHCFEAQGKFDEAAQWYATVTKNPRLADLGLWNLARVQELSGQRQLAAETYRRLLTEHPDSVYVSLANDRLIDLEG